MTASLINKQINRLRNRQVNRLTHLNIYRMTDQWTNGLSYKVQENQLYGLNTQDALKKMINSGQIL